MPTSLASAPRTIKSQAIIHVNDHPLTIFSLQKQAVLFIIMKKFAVQIICQKTLHQQLIIK